MKGRGKGKAILWGNNKNDKHFCLAKSDKKDNEDKRRIKTILFTLTYII